jgi:hypothetical protein
MEDGRTSPEEAESSLEEAEASPEETNSPLEEEAKLVVVYFRPIFPNAYFLFLISYFVPARGINKQASS